MIFEQRLHSRTVRWILPVGLALTLSSCGGTSASSPGTTQGEAQPAKAGSHWSYDGSTGPAHWGSLEAGFAACATGSTQSPIDLPTALPEKTSDGIEITYQDAPLQVINNGHTIQANFSEGSSITIGGTVYPLRQLHFHSHSEHTIGGKQLDMVVHLVHVSDQGKIAVIGVLMKTGGPDNPLIERIWHHIPGQSGGESAPAGVSINAAELLPASRKHYRLMGSLTTPPCTEGVLWSVMVEPIEVSARQIAAFRHLYPNNARPVQPRNDREISLVQ